MTAAFVYRCSLALVLLGHAEGAPPDASKNLSEYARGIFAELEGDAESARRHFETTLGRDPGSFTVARKTAEFQGRDDLSAAVTTLRTFAADHPGHLPSHLHYADFLEQHATRDALARKSAKELLTAANARFPNNPEVYSRLINLLENEGARDHSLAVFRAQFEAEGAGPEHWMALAPIARTLLPGGGPELSEKLDLIAENTAAGGLHLEAAVRSSSDHFRRTGRLGKAIEILQGHVELQPDSLEMRTRLGLLQLYAKQEDAALTTLHTTLEIDPDQLLTHKALAQYYARHGEPAKALHHNAEVLRIAGGSPEDFLELADRYLDQGKPHEARLLLEKARFDHPDHPALAARLAIATLHEKDAAAAVLLFRQAEALAEESAEPGAAEALDTEFQIEFAGALRQSGNVRAAESRLRNTIRNIPPDQPERSAHALRELARIWIDEGTNIAPATALLKRAESLEPGNPETKDLLERARGK